MSADLQTWDVDLEDEGCRGCPFPAERLIGAGQICGLAATLPIEEDVAAERGLPTPAAHDGPTPAPAWCPLRGGAVLVKALDG